MLLASGDNVSISMSVIGLIANALIVIGLARVTAWQKRFDRREDQHRQDMAAEADKQRQIAEQHREEMNALAVQRHREIEAMDIARRHEVEAIEQRLHTANDKLIDERFRGMMHDLKGHVAAFQLTLESLTKRLTDGEQSLAKLFDNDHAVEIKSMNRLEQVKDYIRDHTASKADVREHEKAVARQFDALNGKIESLKVSVAELGAKVEGHA